MLGAVLYTRRVSLGGPEVTAYIGLSAGATMWAWAYALQLHAKTVAATLAYNDIVWVGIACVGASWPVFALAVAGDHRLLTRGSIAVFVLVPATTAALVITNPAHGLMYADISVVEGRLVRLDVDPRVGFLAFVVYSYLLNLGVLWRLAANSRAVERTTRVRRLLVFAAGAIPIVAGTVSLFVSPVDSPPVDLTPVMFAMTTVITGIAVTRYRLLDSTAVVRDHVVRHLPDPVVVVDGDGVVRSCNDVADRYFDLRGLVPVPAATAFEDYPDLLTTLHEQHDATAASDRSTVELTTARVDGPDAADDADATLDPASADRGEDDRRRFTVSIARLSDTDATVLLFRDITVQHRAQQRATVLNRVLRHDLRNDLAVLSGYVDRLETHLRDRGDDAGLEQLAVIAQRAGEMISVTKQAATAEDVAVGETRSQVFDIRALIERRCRSLNEEHTGVDLDVDLPGDAVSVAAPGVFPSVIDNTIENAIEHNTADSPVVEVSLRVDADEGTAVFRVCDNGPGLSERDRAVVVGDASLDEASGLGLWLINRIVTQAGGRVDTSSASLGEACLELTLPLAEDDTFDGASDSLPVSDTRDKV